jgi:hypothetical protein
MTEQSQRPQNPTALLIIAWLWVLLPFGYGVYELIRKVSQLFS